MITNMLQIKSQINNLRYIRRQKPEVADGIGSWMRCLDILSHVNVVTNCMMLTFTQKSYRHIFVDQSRWQDSTNPQLVMNEFQIQN
jgi:hypothetical protein